MTNPEAADGAPARPASPSLVARITTWILAGLCFYLVYRKIEEAAARDSLTVLAYLGDFFANANWAVWLAVMVGYSVFFFLVDSHATWRVIKWFHVPTIRYTDILPIRGSAYILSLVNEQVGKGAMALYLYRRHRVPGWEVASSMIFLGVVEIYQLFTFSAIGVALYYDLVVAASTQIPLNQILPALFLLTGLYLPVHLLYFSGRLLPSSTLRDKPLFHTFRRARFRDYVLILLFKAPNLLAAVAVYTVALRLFHVEIAFGQMLAFLPVIFLSAALPLPFHAGALLLWTVLFPDYPEVGAFSLVMHTFFVSFNAAIGVLFLPRANRELFAETDAMERAGA